MKKELSILFLYLVLSSPFSINTSIKPKMSDENNNFKYEKEIVVVIPSYNNEKWYKKNLDSVVSQNYKNYRVIYIDDNSKDQTRTLVKQYISEHNINDKFILIENTTNVGALKNLFKVIHSCKNETIIITLDGDDWLAHSNVLQIINEAYINPNVWITYGQFEEYPSGQIGFNKPFPKNIIKNNNFRNHQPGPSHLRTFYAGLFKLIKIEDLLYKNKFYPMTWDLAMMFPMLEMASKKHKFIKDVLYIYNNENPISDHRKNWNLQKELSNIIRSQKKYQLVQWQDIINAPTITI